MARQGAGSSTPSGQGRGLGVNKLDNCAIVSLDIDNLDGEVARMPAGYSSRCKVCNSQHRAEIEKWVKEEGVSTREAAKRLADLGEKVSHEAIRRHMIEHFDVRAEAREQYQKSQEQFQEVVKKRLSDIEMLDAIIQGDFELHQSAKAWLDDLVAERKRIPKTLVDLLAATAGEVRQQLKQKQAMLGEDPTERGLEDLADILRQAWDVVNSGHSEAN